MQLGMDSPVREALQLGLNTAATLWCASAMGVLAAVDPFEQLDLVQERVRDAPTQEAVIWSITSLPAIQTSSRTLHGL